MSFTIDSPARYSYVDTGHGPLAVRAVAVEARAITLSVQEVVERFTATPEPSGYRITHVFQVANEDDESPNLQYVESMDVDTWEHITSAIDVMLTRTRAEGWTVSITVAQRNLPGAEIDADGVRQVPRQPMTVAGS